jgi:Protein of unknown function (DUF2637)
VALLAVIAGTVSYLHMHQLVAGHGQPGWVAALTPLSVDGMIVADSTALLADSRSGGRGGLLPWALLVIGSVASLAANVAVAEPTPAGRVIAAWPSFALIGSYELLMRQVRRAAGNTRPNKPAGRRRNVVNDTTSASVRSPVAGQHGRVVGDAVPGLAAAGNCSCRPGSGRGLTGQVMARCRRARLLPASMVGRSAGADLSSLKERGRVKGVIRGFGGLVGVRD